MPDSLAQTLRVLDGGRSSGGGMNLLTNVALAKELSPEMFSEAGIPVVTRNVVPPQLLRTGGFVYIPQNAWAWAGPAIGTGETRRRSLLRVASSAAAARAKAVIRLGPSIPRFNNSLPGYLPNVLDSNFEIALTESETSEAASIGPDEPFVLIPGSLWGYRNIQTAVQGFQRAQAARPNLRLEIVGPLSDESGIRDLVSEARQIRGVTVTTQANRGEILNAMKRAESIVFSSLVEA